MPTKPFFRKQFLREHSISSSAGKVTDHLSAHVKHTFADTLLAASGQKVLALALIVCGVIWLLVRLINFDSTLSLPSIFSDSRDVTLFTPALVICNVAGVGLLFALWRRSYLFLVLGCLFAGIAFGEGGRLAYLFYTWSNYTEPAWGTNAIPLLWGLCMSTLGLQLLGHLMFKQRSYWPLYFVVGLMISGFSITAMVFTSLITATLIWLPLLLASIGVAFVCRRTP